MSKVAISAVVYVNFASLAAAKRYVSWSAAARQRFVDAAGCA
jgi:hypothetical protein